MAKGDKGSIRPSLSLLVPVRLRLNSPAASVRPSSVRPSLSLLETQFARGSVRPILDLPKSQFAWTKLIFLTLSILCKQQKSMLVFLCENCTGLILSI